MLASTSRRSLASTALRAQSQSGRRFASSISTKYSQATYKAALSKSPNTLFKVQTELAAVSQSLKSSPQLDAFVKNPLLASSERAEGLRALYKAADTGAGAGAGAAKGEGVSEVTKNLFAVLSENGRLAETPDVIEGFNELVAKYKGELEIVVTSASALPKDVLLKLETTLKQSETAKQAKVLKVTNKVNPSLLGGFLVDVGDKTIDLSVASRVTKLNSALQETV